MRMAAGRGCRWVGVAAAAAWLVGTGGFGAAAGTGGTRAASLSPQVQQRLAQWAKTALGSDAAASDAALADLEAAGEAARPRLLRVLEDLLVRERAAVTAALRQIGDAAQANVAVAEMDDLRRAARDNIARLAQDETLSIAHEYYDRLAAKQKTLNDLFAVRLSVRDTMVRRAKHYAQWQRAGGSDPRFAAAAEDALRKDAESALGMTVAAAAAIPAFDGGGGPVDDPAARALWFYEACRRIAAHNETLRPLMSDAEAENVGLVNAYRESLGVLPLEVDARLIQSARRHSQEMATLGYFAHESPTPSEKTHIDRMRNAGYPSGVSENIAQAATSGARAFWMWFDSPPHHQNMVGEGFTAFGVGQWNGRWTQNFGNGPRLMLLSPEARQGVTVTGTLVPPQKASEATSGSRDDGGRSDPGTSWRGRGGSGGGRRRG